MSLVALPLLPDRGYGPYQSVNPHELWLLTIAMAAVSFVADGAIRIFGPSRGLIVASAAGSLVSSTAVVLHLARLNREAPAGILGHVGGALLAGAVMAVRLSTIAAVLAPALFQRLVLPMAAFAGLSAVLGLAAAMRSDGQSKGQEESPMKSPLDIGLVFKFALVLGAIMAAARILSALYGGQGLLPIAVFGGLADADALTLAAARMAHEGLGVRLAAGAVLLAAGANSVSKAVIAAAVGGPRFGALFAGGTLLAAAAAAMAWYWVA